jgi:uncharacterized protein YicC (UPF0701 family)
MPHQLAPLEERIKRQVATKVSRGRVDVVVKAKDGSEKVPKIEVNLSLAKAYYKALSELNETLETRETVGLQTLLGLEGIITAVEPEVDLEKTWAALSSCIDEVLEGVDIMRTSAICIVRVSQSLEGTCGGAHGGQRRVGSKPVGPGGGFFG